MIHYARVDLFYWLSASPDAHLSPWLNGDWLLIRNLFGLLLFYGLSAVYVLKALRPDLTGAAEAGKVDHREVERQLYLMSPLVIIGFVLCNTFFAWDFAMMLIPHWHSTVFPIHFWFGNLYAGTSNKAGVRLHDDPSYPHPMPRPDRAGGPSGHRSRSGRRTTTGLRGP